MVQFKILYSINLERLKKTTKISVMMSGFRTETRYWDFQNTEHNCYPVNNDIQKGICKFTNVILVTLHGLCFHTLQIQCYCRKSDQLY